MKLSNVSSLSLTESDINMSLTTAGLLPERVEKVVKIYSDTKNWEETKRKWHKSRLGNRGSRSSSQKIFNIIKSRLKAGERSIKPLENLSENIKKCETRCEKSQIFYLYLLEYDSLVKYVVSKVFELSSSENFDFSNKNIRKILKNINYVNGKKVEYSDSTLNKWIRNLRTLMREIGVITSKQEVKGRSPNLSKQVLNISAQYSNNTQGEEWIQIPLGWIYLFQPPVYWESLIKRLVDSGKWQITEIRGKRKIKPID